MPTNSLSFRYPLEKQEPRLGPGGITRGASVREFPASIGIAGVSMRLAPGGMRELHWHANAAEWAYVITGYCRTTIIHPDGSSYIDTLVLGMYGIFQEDMDIPYKDLVLVNVILFSFLIMEIFRKIIHSA
jgi:oxalate decarboxylase/phosphoglucose isomerase-like protein (cupin superfamily)